MFIPHFVQQLMTNYLPEDPFRDPPKPAHTKGPFVNDDSDEELSAFMGFHPSTYTLPSRGPRPHVLPTRGTPVRQSPNIFARLSRVQQVPVQLSGTPSLRPDKSHGDLSPRKLFTSNELPKRELMVSVDSLLLRQLDLEMPSRSPLRSLVFERRAQFEPSRHPSTQLEGALFQSEGTGATARLLEPPKPIFLPETYLEAASDEASTKRESIDYGYDSYQKEYEHLAYLEDVDTVYDEVPSEKSGLSYFGDSIDGKFMEGLANYIPGGALHQSEHRRKVRLVGNKTGNLVLENPIPEELKKVLTVTEFPFGEFTNMTYTACTLEPDDFVADGYLLRAAKYGRETEIIICITMYNEDEVAFARTMHGVMKNVAHLCLRNKLLCWGKDGWKKIQVVIVADGRNKVNEQVLQLLTATGCYQDNLTRPFVNNREVKAHLFEYTTQISIDEQLKFKGDEKNLTPVQVLFCLKEKNQKKINSHRWLFNAFCPVLDPNVIILLDVGTKPDNHAIYHMWKAFDRDSNVAGVAGEIKAMKGKGWGTMLRNPLVASQNFEYKMSNILDKPLESLFGYITVLPGALSGYRYIALCNHPDGTGPLNSYFKGEDLLSSHVTGNSKTNFFEANMYLAEDRILCWELVAKKGENWVLKFVKQATGETDVPELVAEFLSQRRRWMNGAFFAALYSLRHHARIWSTDHLYARKFWFLVEFVYQFVLLVFSFFSIANFYLTFYFLTGSLTSDKGIGRAGFWVFTIFNYLCICVLTLMFLVSIGNRPQALKNIFKTLIILLTVCALYALIVGFYFVINTIIQFGMNDDSLTYVFVLIVVSLLSTYGLYTIMLILYLDPWHMFTCSIQYFLMIPSYTCTLQIFAFCNTHDVSWGTKGDNNPKEDRSNQYIIEKNEQGEFEAVVVDTNIDENYLETLYQIRMKRANNKIKTVEHSKPVLEGEDYAKDVRTKVVLIWMVANLLFIMIMLQVYEPGETKSNVYLAFILWLVAILSLFRAIGSLGYLINNGIRMAVESKNKWHYKRASAVPNSLN